MNQSRTWLLLLVCVLCLLLIPAFGQRTDGTIEGVVTDPTGAVVANAPVTITNTGTGLTRNATTDASGFYTAPNLPPGNYEVVVKASNFKENRTHSVELHVASTTTVNVVLVLGSTSEQVEVAANAIQVQTGSAQLGEVIDSTQVSELPLNGRSFVQLTQLSPGVSGANNFDSKNKGLQGGVDFSVNGNPTTNNLFLIDGANNNDVGSNRTILLYPSNEAIAEFKMMRNAYGAEYGQASGGVINILTKSGTNQWHGSALYFGRNDALSTFEYFAAQAHAQNPANKKDVLRRNDWGYSIGGPVVKDKLFFFWSEEWNHEKRGLTRTSCVPTAEERAGDFSNPSCTGTVPDFKFNDPIHPFPHEFVDPNNPAKLASLNPAGVLLISKYPLPNLPNPTTAANNWAQSESSQLKWREENVRVDFNLTKTQTLMFRYTQDTWTNPGPTGGVYWGDDFFPGLTGSWAQPSKQLVGKWTSLIGGNTVNEVEFAYSNNRINIGVGGTNPGLQQQISDVIGPIYPESIKHAKASVPTIWGGFGNYGSGQNYWVIAPWQNQLDIYTVRDDLSKVIGNHTLKVGAFLGWNAKDEDNSASSAERPTFGTADWDTTLPTGNNLTNVLVPGVQSNGDPGALWGLSEVSTNVRDQLRWRDYEFYVADNWKVTRNLTLDLGLRYSLLMTPYQPDGNFTTFVPSLYDPAKPASDACNGLWIVPGKDPCGNANKQFGTTYSKGVDAPNKYLRDQNYHLFAPRIGIAWDPKGDGKMAVRAGIGQFYQRERVSPNNGLAANAPFAVNGFFQRALDSQATLTGGSASPTAGINPTTNVPSSWQWNLSVQHSFAKDTALEIGYVGNRAMHLTSRYDVNAILSTGTTANCNIGDGAAIPYTNIPNWTCAAFLNTSPQNGALNINQLRPYSNFGAINYFDRGGDATYHSLQMLFKTKYKRSALTAAYTWSHSISDVQLDDSSGGASAGNYYDYTRPWLDRGNSPINRPHIFVANAYYYFPDLKGSSAIARNIAGGWEVSVITTAASGNSHTVYQNSISDVNGGKIQSITGTGYAEPLRPLITGQSCDAGRSGNQLYNPAAFTLVGYQIGTTPSNLEPRGYCPGPHLVNTDFSLDKNWKLTERFNMRFALDFFNLFNHPNFRGDQVQGYTLDQKVACGTTACSPTNNVITAEVPTNNFGKSSQTTNKAGREIQYSLKITF